MIHSKKKNVKIHAISFRNKSKYCNIFLKYLVSHHKADTRLNDCDEYPIIKQNICLTCSWSPKTPTPPTHSWSPQPPTRGLPSHLPHPLTRAWPPQLPTPPTHSCMVSPATYPTQSPTWPWGRTGWGLLYTVVAAASVSHH